MKIIGMEFKRRGKEDDRLPKSVLDWEKGEGAKETEAAGGEKGEE